MKHELLTITSDKITREHVNKYEAQFYEKSKKQFANVLNRNQNNKTIQTYQEPPAIFADLIKPRETCRKPFKTLQNHNQENEKSLTIFDGGG